MRRYYSPMLRFEGLYLDPITRRVTRGTVAQQLTRKEARLLAALIRAQGEVMTREDLMREVWDTDYVEDTRILEVYIHRLRQKVEKDPRRPKYVRTVRGVGYRLCAPSGDVKRRE